MKVATVSLDAAGRLVVPEPIRTEAGLSPGMTLEIRYRDGRVELEPPAQRVQIVEKGGVHVAVPAQPVETLTAGDVRAMQETLRNRHAED